jgi:ribosomal protein L11 methyltransferase
VHRYFPPQILGGFYIYGSHSKNAAGPELIPLNIDAATAFGSGEHETTKGCLLLLEGLKNTAGFAPRRGLDMGCGSGILAIAMKKLWPDMAVLAVDIDPESVRVTARHAVMNQTPLKTEAGDGYDAPSVTADGPHDLIAANILAGPLVEMAPALARHLAPGGYAILSGLLARQRQDVNAAHAALGLSPRAELVLGDWAALLFQKPR